MLLVPDLPEEFWPSMDRYALRLARHLTAADPDLSFDVAIPLTSITDPSEPMETVQRDSATPMFMKLAKRFAYKRIITQQTADLYHILDHSYAHLIAHLRAPAVVTVHDMLPMMQAAEPGKGVRVALRSVYLNRMLAAIRQAAAWIVGTQYMKRQLANWMGRDANIHVVPFGLDSGFKPAKPSDPLRFGVPPGDVLVLHVGSSAPRKNLEGVVEIVARLRQRGVDAWLVQIGAGTDHLGAVAESRQIGQWTKTVDMIGESELRLAYQSADFFVFPSTYEGFGFPLLEAMASGLPVLTSGAGGSAEVVGDGAVIVSSNDPDGYAVEIESLLASSERRSALVERGLKRAKEFNWDRCARDTAAVYRSMLG